LKPIMKKIKIMFSKGWYRIVYAFTFLLFAFICSCSSSKAASKDKAAEENDVETPDEKETNTSDNDEPQTIHMRDFQGLGKETPQVRLMYGVQIPRTENR